MADDDNGWVDGRKKLKTPMAGGISMAMGTSDGKVHGRYMGASDQCLELHPDAHLLDSWCVLAYPHEGQAHQYNQEPGPTEVFPFHMPA